MINDLSEVRKKLREKILQGYDPIRDFESAEDHWVDWLVLPEKEFEELKRAALKEREVIRAGASSRRRQVRR